MADREQGDETQNRATTSTGTTGTTTSRGRRSEGNGGTRADDAQAQGAGTQPSRGTSQDLQGEGTESERRPRYGYFYAMAVRRVAQRPQRSGVSSYGGERGEGGVDYGQQVRYGSQGFGEQQDRSRSPGFIGYGREGEGQQGGRSSGGSSEQDRGRYGQTAFGGSPRGRQQRHGGGEGRFGSRTSGFTESSFGQGGGLGDRGSYGSQYIRGTGGQSGRQLGYGGGGSELGSGELEQGREHGRTGLEDRERQERERGLREWQENRERFERGRGQDRLQDRDWDVGSRFEEGRYAGGRSQATRGDWGRDEESRWSGRFGGEGRGEEGWSGESAGAWGTQLGIDTERRGRRTRWHREPVTAGEIMTRDVKAVTKQSTLQNVAQIMKDENCGIVPIVDENHKLLGVVTDRDLVIRSLAGDKSPLECKVEDVMTDDVHAVTPDEELRDVIELMGGKQVRRVPVVDRDDRLIGIIAMGDVANRADYDEDLQDALEEVSSKRSFWSRLWS